MQTLKLFLVLLSLVLSCSADCTQTLVDNCDAVLKQCKDDAETDEAQCDCLESQVNCLKDCKNYDEDQELEQAYLQAVANLAQSEADGACYDAKKPVLVEFEFFEGSECEGSVVASGSVPVDASKTCEKLSEVLGEESGATGSMEVELEQNRLEIKVNMCSGDDCSGCSGSNFELNTDACTASTTANGLTPTTGSFRVEFSDSGKKCFHEDTQIQYEGQTFSLAELKATKMCSIPHIVAARGRVINIDCSGEQRVLRVTGGHLVYTQRGLQEANTLKPFDTVYADMKEQIPCSVTSVAQEPKAAKYFGLNCHSSVVLADGIKASCFEKIHSVPSFWMAVMGRVLGIETASNVGLYIQQLAEQLKLV